MQVINSLIERSFEYTAEKENLAVRKDEIGDLMEIIAYCQDDAVKEPLEYQEALWETCVEEGITFTDWLYGEGTGSNDDRRRMLEAISKKALIESDKDGLVYETSNMKNINITLGEFRAGVSTVEEYVHERREILCSIRKVTDYEAFMQSCFINSRFAKGILSAMKHISNFPDNTKEITKALGILNDDAVELYQQYSTRLEEAMRILSARLQRECAPDPKHSEDLRFTFTYSENIEGDKVAKTKDIECSPHLKLLHPGSDLRIYFYWCDDVIEDGKKVLVGRIGRHPY